MNKRTINNREASARLAIGWGAMLVLFWVLVFTQISASNRNPVYTAATRSIPQIEEVLWRYTGPRPAEGEILRVYHRNSLYPPSAPAFNVIGRLGSEKAPATGAAWFKGEPSKSPDFIEEDYVDIPPWPEGREIWIGLWFNGTPPVWMERGDATFAGFDSFPHTRKKGRALEVSDKEWIPGVRAIVLPENAPPVPVGRPWILVGVYLFGFLCLTPLIRDHRRVWVCGVILNSTLLFKAFEAQFPSQWLWGGYYLSRYGSLWFWLGLVAVQLLTIPAMVRVLDRTAGFLLKGFSPRYAATTLYMLSTLAAVAGLSVLAWRNPSLGIYGDGYGSLSHPGYDYHNPFATALFHMVLDAVNWANGRGWLSFQTGLGNMLLIPPFVSAFMPFYVLGVALAAWELGRNRREKLLLFLIFLSLKTTLTLFGYMEVYGPVLAVHAWLLFFILRSHRTGEVMLPTLFSFFSYLFHMAGAVVLPVIAGLWIRALWRSRAKVRWLTTRLAACASAAILIWLLCLGTLYIFKHDQKIDSYKAHVPAPKSERLASVSWFHGLPMLYASTGLPSERVYRRWKPAEGPWTPSVLWSRKTASQVIGEVIFVAGPALPLLLAGLFFRLRPVDPLLHFSVLATAALSFGTAAMVITSFPYPKDWDFMATKSFWWIIALMVMVARGGILNASQARWLLWALLLYYLWDTIPWVHYNLTWGPPAWDRHFVFM